MSIEIIANTKTGLVADYIGKDKTVKNIRLVGDFSDMKKARTEVATHLLMRRIINAGQYLGFISAINSPRSKEFYSKIGKKGLDNRWGKK